jgi:hypothetical protein
LFDISTSGGIVSAFDTNEQTTAGGLSNVRRSPAL